MPHQSAIRNRLLARMSADDFALLEPHFVSASYERGAVLIEAHAPISSVFFLESGMASVVARSPEGHQVEAGLIGREGFVHPAAILGADRLPYLVQMQMPDDAFRIAREPFQQAIEQSASLRRLLLLYVHAFGMQTSFTVLANATHSVEERLARWLLMCHDRSDDDELRITHEFMAIMLAVRRPTVTNALHILEGNGFIRADRGLVRLRNRDALLAYASDAYGVPEAEYDRLLHPSVASPLQAAPVEHLA